MAAIIATQCNGHFSCLPAELSHHFKSCLADSDILAPLESYSLWIAPLIKAN